MGFVPGHNAVGMCGAVMVDVVYGLFHSVNDSDVQDVIIVLGVPVLLGGRSELQVLGACCCLEKMSGGIIDAELNMFLTKLCGYGWQVVRRDRSIDQQRLHG